MPAKEFFMDRQAFIPINLMAGKLQVAKFLARKK